MEWHTLPANYLDFQRELEETRNGFQMVKNFITDLVQVEVITIAQISNFTKRTFKGPIHEPIDLFNRKTYEMYFQLKYNGNSIELNLNKSSLQKSGMFLSYLNNFKCMYKT